MKDAAEIAGIPAHMRSDFNAELEDFLSVWQQQAEAHEIADASRDAVTEIARAALALTHGLENLDGDIFDYLNSCYPGPGKSNPAPDYDDLPIPSQRLDHAFQLVHESSLLHCIGHLYRLVSATNLAGRPNRPRPTGKPGDPPLHLYESGSVNVWGPGGKKVDRRTLKTHSPYQTFVQELCALAEKYGGYLPANHDETKGPLYDVLNMVAPALPIGFMPMTEHDDGAVGPSASSTRRGKRKHKRGSAKPALKVIES